MHSTLKNVVRQRPGLNEASIAGRFLTYPQGHQKRVAEGGLRVAGKFKKRASADGIPLVTIITVCLNSAATLEQCLQSVFQQSYENVEYLVIDGGSADSTLELITKYEHALDYYLSEPDGGLYQAMNKGLALATGDYILILNSDDWYAPDCIEALVRAKKYSGASFVSALAQAVNGAGEPLEIMRRMPYDESVRLRMPLRHETMLLSADLYNAVGEYDDRYRIGADFDYTVRLYEAGHTLYELQRPLLFFRNNGVSNSKQQVLFDERVAVLLGQFPFLESHEARLLASRDEHTLQQLLDLSGRYPHQEKLISAVRLYAEDNLRHSRRPQWKKSRDTKASWPVATTAQPKPLVSVILPVFNAQDTLRECIDSVLAQTLEGFELICINDATPDDSQKIIEGYQSHDPRLVSLVNDRNIGLGATRNKGVRHARGSYIFHIDPDDTIPPRALETLYAQAVRHGSDMVKGAYLREQFHHHTALKNPEIRNVIKNSGPIVNADARDVPDLLTTPEGHWSFLYKAELAKQVLYPTDLKMGQDAVFLVCALLRARTITIIDDVVYRYRLNPSSVMNAFSFRKYLDVLEWRRRAWHMLNDAGLRQIGDRLMQGYTKLLWHDLFFKHYRASPDGALLQRLSEVIQCTFRETGLASISSGTHGIFERFLECLADGQVERAAELIAGTAAGASAIGSKGANAIRQDKGPETDARKNPTKPLVSVILPVFNAQATLRECIDSVLAQTLQDFELICINDVSADGSQGIIDSYTSSDRRVISLTNDTNIGHGATRNRGVRHARGSYIFHIDPDDTIPPRALETLHVHAAKHGSDMVKGAYLRQQLLFGESPQKAELKGLCRGGPPIVNTSLAEMPELLRTTEGHWSFLYEADLARRYLYPADLRMGPDSLFLATILPAAKRITIIDEVVYHYRANPASAMNTFNFRKFKDALEWRRRVWHVLNDAGFRAIGNRLLQSYWGDAFFSNLASRVSREELTEFLDKFRSVFAETGIPPIGEHSTKFLKTLFPLIIEGQDEDARRLMLSRAAGKASAPVAPRDKAVRTTTVPAQTRLRVATFCSTDHGGAGTGSQRRVAALRKHGIDARIFSLVVKSAHDYVQRITPELPLIDNSQQTEVWQVVTERAISRARKVPGYCAGELFSLADAVLDFRTLGGIFDAHDVIHLHWVVGMLDYENLGDVLANKPIVWTLADMNPFTGGCHYSEGCEEYKRECRRCPLLGGESDLAHETWKIKKRAYEKLENLHIICPSPWMAERVRESSLLGDKTIHYIPNALPVDQLALTAKTVARIRLGLPLNKKLLLFGSERLANLRKGADLLKAVLRHFCSKGPRQGVELVMFGSGSIDAPLPVHRLGYVYDLKRLALMYAAADAYLFPSREDNAPLTVAEALLCGTPVVAFPVGNVRALVEHRVTGYIANHLDTRDFADGIEWMLNASPVDALARSARCRLHASAVHDPATSSERHEAVYRLAMNGTVEIPTTCPQ